ncbi:MAG TPA: N-acetylmuramoyl-L-alanine amidase, partial [Deltaproteobacteria bacterium]|nr:N-acetylmuramoyl-L-alanine amidase [Deltaproteobacteria bacterium]
VLGGHVGREARGDAGLPHNMTIKDGILETIRISQNQKDKVRIVMDLNAHGSYKAFPLENPARIVLDVSKKPDRIVDRPEEKPLARSKPGIQRVRSHAHSQVAQDVPSIAKQLSLKVSRIVIDPGHGGNDPGAIGPGGEKEKDITLAVGKVLARRLKAEGFEVFMTRETDVFIPLEERTAFANKRKADLFVSVHVNAHADSGVRGIETYILNLTTDASSIQVAARENATTSKSLSDLQFIINDLMLTSKINESSRFATSTQKSIISTLEKAGHGGKDLGVKQAPFYVLMGAQMPSILVEIGFITNTAECELIQDREYQNSIVEGIISGINSYIDNTSYAFNNGRSS